MVLALVTSAASAQDSTKKALDTVRVVSHADDLHGIAPSASQGHIDIEELRALPLSREGKANQYFARGFNLDHGTDFATSVDGMPVNDPSHAHGQGYTDLNFLIPELVTSLDYRLGVYYADVGDFGSAGSSEFHLAQHLAAPFVSLTSGENGLNRIVAAGSAGDLLVAGEVKGYDGPWRLAEEERKFSGL